MIKKCPHCGSANPPSTFSCSCGYNFQTGQLVLDKAPREKTQMIKQETRAPFEDQTRHQGNEPPNQLLRQQVVLKKRSVVVMWFFTLLTAGFYVPFWFLARRKALNSLADRSHQISLGSCITMLVFQSLSLLIDSGVLNLETEFDQSIASFLLNLAWFIIVVILSFQVRAILNFVQRYPLSATHTGFLTIFYLQYRMNRLGPEISSSLAPSSTHPREKELTGEKGWWSRNWKWAIPAVCFGSTVLFAGLAMLIFYSGNEVVQDVNSELIEAAQNGQTEKVQALLEAGADVNAKASQSGMTPLDFAALFGHTETVAVLLDAGADVDAKDNDGGTALMGAALLGHTENAKALLDAGADVNAKDKLGRTVLMIAASSGATDTVEILLAKGAEINAKDPNGKTSLILASEKVHVDIVKVLLTKGADVNAKASDGYTALMSEAFWGHTENAKALLEAGADVNAKDSDGFTALMRVAKKGHTDTAKALLEAGADVNAKDNEGGTALMLAEANGHTGIVELLKKME